jgi:hypothetical protein
MFDTWTKKIVVFFSTLALVMATLFTAIPAQAAGQICTNGGGGHCLNNWNGGGINNNVKMGQNGWSHQDFGTAQLTQLCGSGRVTNTCPNFGDATINTALLGSFLVVVKNISSGLCVGSGQFDNRGLLETCPNTAGNGGGWGTILIERQNVNNCFAQNGDTQLTSNHWTALNDFVTNLTGSETNGAQTTFVGNVSLEACWGTGLYL